jgi:N6-adenosine-specific RNA methylase IME4
VSRRAPARTLVADPPWRFDDPLPGPARGAATHYETLRLPAILRFPLPPLAPDCRLFLWRTTAHQADALDVVRAWGFELKSELVWRKVTLDGTRPRLGMGRQVRMAHEVCLIAVRGRPERLRANVPSVFDAPRQRHSEKPDAFYELVEGLSPPPYVELFARRGRPGWLAYGKEAAIDAPPAVPFPEGVER